MKAMQIVLSGLVIFLIIGVFYSRLNAQGCGLAAVEETVSCVPTTTPQCNTPSAINQTCSAPNDPTQFCFVGFAACCATDLTTANSRTDLADCGSGSCKLRDHYHPRLFLASKCKSGALYQGEILIFSNQEETLAEGQMPPRFNGVREGAE